MVEVTNLHVAVLPYTADGGLSTYAIELSEALAERGTDVTLLGVRGYVGNGKIQFKTLPCLESIKCIRDPAFRNALIGAEASDILRSSSVDIVHCVYPTLVPFIRLRKAIVCSGWFNPHNLLVRLSIATKMSAFSLSRFGELWGQVEYHLLDEFGYLLSKRIFATTRSLEENLRKRFGRKVIYLPPGIKPALGTRRKRDQKVRIACIASDLDNPRKGVSVLLSALELLEPSVSKKVDVCLIGKYSEKLENKVKSLVRRGLLSIELTGYIQRDRIMENLLQTDLLICPSLYEEFGYVIIEAMSTGIPVIGTNIRPMTDMVLHGSSGLLFNKGDMRDLSSLITILVSDQEMRCKMGENAKRRVSEEFSWNSISQRLNNYYEEVLNAC